MKKFSLILFILIFLLPANKASGYMSNASCIDNMTVINLIVDEIASLGLFSAYYSVFDMTDPDGCTTSNSVTYNVTDESDPDPSTATTTYCDYISSSSDCSSGTTHNKVGTQIYYLIIPPGAWQTAQVADTVCVQFWTGFGPQSIGCKYIPDPSFTSFGTSCYSGQSCAVDGTKYSASFFPMVTPVVQCINESIYEIFASNPENGNCSNEMLVATFGGFKDTMYNIVRAAMILQVILLGIKITLSAEIPKLSEIFLKLMKFSFVLGFAVLDDVQTYLVPVTTTWPAAFANLIFSSGGNSTLCVFPPTGFSYPNGYQYLALWDSLDCRFAQYLGLNINSITGELLTWGVLGMIMPAFLAFYLIFAIMLLVFAILLGSIVIFYSHMYMISLVTISILTFMAPIFVPCILFDFTKPYFQAWLKALMGFILQPMVLTAFIGLMLTVIDTAMFSTCIFTEPSISTINYTVPNSQNCTTNVDGNSCSSVPWQMQQGPYLIGLPSGDESDQNSCKESWGYLFGGYANNLYGSTSAIFIDIITLNTNVFNSLSSGMLTLTIFMFIFYNFAQGLADLAGDITGSVGLGKAAISPTEIADRAKNVAIAAAKYAMGDKKGAAESASKAVLGERGGEKLNALANKAMAAAQNGKEGDSKEGKGKKESGVEVKVMKGKA